MKVIYAVTSSLVAPSFSAPVAAQPLADGLGVAYKSPPAPPLALEGLDGEPYDLADYRERVVVVSFWATWCPPCIAEMPAIQSMWEKLSPAGLEVLAVNAGEYSSDITPFLSRFEPHLTFPILLDPSGKALEGWRVRGLPKTYVVGKQGRDLRGGRRPGHGLRAHSRAAAEIDRQVTVRQAA